ncbi:MAG: uncharacterized protein KVP18_003770 [Porospora cf. gigantea A]|uniref:uncharacterized protein n=1 Tax=Porospora cf. gigantea A TaxID=2853593 RepID=UPI0035599F5E|nr:MAG: hypothetical protein KVP18_003770 [Porospora cf. gigantea A]
MSIRVAIVGAGPSGLATARSLIRRLGSKVHIDMFERQSRPFGLARAIAPDHMEMRNVLDSLSKVVDHPSLRIHQTDITPLHLPSLKQTHDALVVATGGDLQAPMPPVGYKGEHLAVSATSVIRWYMDGAPSASERVENELRLPGDTLVLVGAGNVAVDFARILASEVTQLDASAISRTALNTLHMLRIRNPLKRIYIVSRSEIRDVKATVSELRELFARFNVRLETPPPNPSTRVEKLFASLPSTQILPEIVFYFGSQVSEIADGDTKTVSLKTPHGPSTIPDVRTVITCTGIPVSELASLEPESSVYKVGWAATAGKGRIVDAFAQADQVAESIVAELRTRVH